MKYSQNGEEDIIENLLSIAYKVNNNHFSIGEELDHSNKFLVDLGAGDGFHLSNSRYFIEKGWNSILIDADNKGNEEVKQHKIIRENVNELLRYYKCPKAFDLLSIDLDGNDYWILEQILKEYNPKLIVAEFNAAFTDSRTIKYDSEFSWGGDDYFGFTLEAGEKLAKNNGYNLVCQNADMNIFLLRNDVIMESMGNKKYKQSDYFRKSDRNDWEFI
jgi:hypothetical protein